MPIDSEEDYGYMELYFVVNESFYCFFNHSQFNDEIIDKNTSYFQLDCCIEMNSKSFTIKLIHIIHIFTFKSHIFETSYSNHTKFHEIISTYLNTVFNFSISFSISFLSSTLFSFTLLDISKSIIIALLPSIIILAPLISP